VDRHKSFQERYEVGDPCCGVIAYAATRAAAERLLLRCRGTHQGCTVTLTDRMARKPKLASPQAR